MTVEPQTDIDYAGHFLRHSIRRRPVLYEGRLVGATTRFDIPRAIELNRASRWR